MTTPIDNPAISPTVISEHVYDETGKLIWSYPSLAPPPHDLAQLPVALAPNRLRAWARRFLLYARELRTETRPLIRAEQEPPMPLYWLHIKATTAKAGFQRRWFWQRAWDRFWQ